MLSWNVLWEEPNKNKITKYDIFKDRHYEKLAKEIKNQVDTKTEFAKEFRIKLMSQFWARCEYEIICTSWPPYICTENIEKLRKEVFDYKEKWGHFPLRTMVPLEIAEKIDIFSQLDMNWPQFIDYVWNNI